MAIKISKVIKDLNIGRQAIEEFLHKKGIEIDASINARIQDDAYEMLVREFRPDLITEERAKSSDPVQVQDQSPNLKSRSIFDFDWDAYEKGEIKRDKSFEEREKTYDNALNKFQEDEVTEGTVISINKREVVVNIGPKADGIIPISEFRYNPDLKVGDTVEVYVENLQDRKGQLVLSHRRARQTKSWARVNKAFENNEIIKGYIKCRTKGGMLVDVFGIEAFLPGSQIDVRPIRNYDDYVDKTMEFKIVKINQDFRNVVVSHKAVVENNKATTEDKSILKEIWQNHTKVQEQILRQRSIPLSILPSFTTIINEKLHIRVDTSDNTDQLKTTIIEALDLNEEECHFEEGFVYAPIDNWNKLDDKTKTRISSQANKEYVSFTFKPVIDGIITDKKAQFSEVKKLLDNLSIEYDFDKRGRLQITVEELNKLKENKEFMSLEVSLPAITSAIVQTYPSILLYLERFCPNHNFQNIQVFKEHPKILDGVFIYKQLVVEGGYLDNDVLDKIRDVFEIVLNRFELSFRIHEEVVSKYDWKKNPYGLPKPKNGLITFSKEVKSLKKDEYVDSLENNSIIESDSTESDFGDFNHNYTTDIFFEFTLLNRLMKRIFGEGNYEHTERCFYRYRENKEWATTEELNHFKSRLHSECGSDESFSIAKNGSYIGIDYNWKETNLTDILSDLSKKYQFINFGIYKKGHKCNFDIQFKGAGLSTLKNELLADFEGINLDLTKKGTELRFNREFDSSEEIIAFKPHLIQKFKSLNQNRFNYTIYETPSDRVKLLYIEDKEGRDEDRLEAIKELRGACFKVGDLTIGKLIKVLNYPELVFDISGDSFNITKQLFEEGEITSISPDLSGDLEKIARLKESLNRIIAGRDVRNPSLKDFIFDASKAKCINDYEENLRYELQEISRHILNKKIDKNEPQKRAIAISLLAPDLALIQGPPGTGKSTAIAELIWQYIRQNPQKKVLLTSETNLAVDNAIDRVVNPYHNLVKPIRIGDETRLETEGLQFSYSAMYRWANGSDWNNKRKNDSIDDEDEADDEDVVYEAPEKLILLNWMENIARRVDQNRVPENAKTLWNDLLSNPTSSLKKVFFDNYVANCNVIGATCSSIGQKSIILSEKLSNPKSFVPTQFYRTYRQIFGNSLNKNPEITFDMVIQDESSKATPAELSLPLIYGVKNVIIGDHRQLPPMLSRESFVNSFDYLIKREQDADELKKLKGLKGYVLNNFKALEISHFERLYTQIDDKLKGVFNYQFRMHPAINEVIKQFYKDEGGLECGLIKPVDLGIDDADFIRNGASRYHGITAGPIDPGVHVLWIDSDSPEMLDGTSRVNYGEVAIIEKLLNQLHESDSFNEYLSKWEKIEDRQIGLISFYGKQLRLLRNLARKYSPTEIPIRVSTVDRFQGMERNIIIVSMVRSHCIQVDKNQKPDYEKYPEWGFPEQSDLGFAQSPNRLNVALSRAKRLLIIVGNSKLFRTKNIYDNVYMSISQNINGKIINAQEYGL